MKILDRQWKSATTNSQGNKHLESDWEQQILIKLFNPGFFFVCFTRLCLITLSKSLAKDSVQSPFQIIKCQGRPLLNLQKTAYSSLLLFAKLKETISNKTKHPLLVLLQGIKESTKLTLAFVTSFWAQPISNKNIAKKTVVGGTPINKYISKISSAHLISCQLHFLLCHLLLVQCWMQRKKSLLP